MQEPGEHAVKTARRELHEETGLEFAEKLFEELGCFDFRPDKRLHLFKVYAPACLNGLDHLTCTSHFLHRESGVLMPEMDGFCWASRDDIKNLCGPNMQRVLLALKW